MVLYPHNQIAYQSVLQMLEATGKAAVIHPTGTGKSFIGFQLAADYPFDRVLWLAPSEYIFRTQMENWLSAGGRELPNITFLTYAKLSLTSEEDLTCVCGDCPPDTSPREDVSGRTVPLTQRTTPTVIVLDEFHRAGAAQWGLGVDRLIRTCPNARLLGLTATNIRYLDGQRDMADELFDGHIASEMSLGEAIVRGILPAPKYVLSIFKYKDDLAKYELRARHAKSKATRDAAEEILEKLRRALDLAEGLEDIFDRHMADRTGKYLVFCANAEHMRDMIARVPDWFYKVDAHPHVYSAYSEDPETDRAFADFKADTSDHLKLLFCIDMLNEGIHVPDVSGVILLRPTVSPIVYKQQIGRALSASQTVPLTQPPIIFDIVLNIENLYSISSLQEEIEAAVTYYRSLGEVEQIVTDSFTVIDEVHDCLELFDRLNETLTTSWDIMYDQAAKYAREYGNLDVTQRYVTEDGYTLGPWLSTQRLVRAGKAVGVLTPDRIAKLDALGMRWESLADRNWEKYYAAAKKYRESHGDLRVHFEYVTDDGVPLGNWIATMRKSRKSGIRTSYLTPERIELLDALGMTWDVPDFVFESYYASALAWYRAHGTLNVPSQYVDPDGLKLGRWLAQLRTKRRKGALALTDGQIARLDELGMTWGNRLDSAWESGFRHAAEYYETHHDLLVPPSWKSPDGFRLGDWVSNQRERWREGGIRPDRRERLESIAMVWELPDSWDVRYALAEKYFLENGNLNVPSDYVLDGVWLGRWLDEQRKNKANLPPERVEKLDRLGIFWGNRLERLWEEGFSHARDYAREYRNLRVPKSYVCPDGFKLGSWITDQRVKASAGRLKPERKLQLDSLGMIW